MFKKIEITKKDFFPLLNWCLIKFKLDPSSRQGIGGREDKIGGFIDRFSNQCVNWMILNHMLSNENLKVDPDMFFYNAKSAKKCADVIGIKGKDNKLVTLTYFDKDKWVHKENAPFVEVKALRKSQNCCGLGLPQFDANHYYVYVESEFNELYLYNFFENFSEQDLKMSESYIKDNSENIIKEPIFDLPDNIATLRLLGVYKGSELKKHNLEYKPGENPRYITSIEPVNEEDIPTRIKFSRTINSDRFIYEPRKRMYEEFLPIYTNSKSIEIRHGKEEYVSKLYLKVNKKCFFNEHDLDEGFYIVNFKEFQRSGKEIEIFNHKSVYDTKCHKSNIFPTEASKELILKLKEFFIQN